MFQARRSTPDIVHSLPPTSSSAVTQYLALSEALALGEDAWESLRRRAASGGPFASWGWHDAWNATASRSERDETVVIAVSNADGELQALVPLACRRVIHRRLRVTALTWAIGDTGCPDHLDVLATGAAPMEHVAAAIEALEWDIIRLDGLANDATGARHLQGALAARGISVTLRRQSPCPYLDLPASWEEYIATRGATRRRSIARRERMWMATSNPAIHLYEGPESAEGWRELMRLHQTHWGSDSAFDARAVLINEYFLMHLSPTRRLWLATLDIDGSAVAAWYGFTDGDTLYFYQGGRDPAWNSLGVASLLLGTMIRRAIALGVRHLDFLRGDEPYKLDWTDTTRWTVQLVGFRRGVRASVLRAVDGLADARDQRRARRAAPAGAAT